MIQRVFGFAGQMYKIVRPVRDRHYLRYIRRFACVGCKTEVRYRDAIHTGPRGLGQKASDRQAVPGCRPCHRELHAIGPLRFQFRHRIDFGELAVMFQGFYKVEFPALADSNGKPVSCAIQTVQAPEVPLADLPPVPVPTLKRTPPPLPKIPIAGNVASGKSPLRMALEDGR